MNPLDHPLFMAMSAAVVVIYLVIAIIIWWTGRDAMKTPGPPVRNPRLDETPRPARHRPVKPRPGVAPGRGRGRQPPG